MPPDFIGAGHNGAFLDSRMLHQRILHLEGADGIARADNNIVAPALEPEVAFLIPLGPVSGDEIIPAHTARLPVRVLVIRAEQSRHIPVDADIPDLACGERLARFADDLHHTRSRSQSHGADFHGGVLQGPDKQRAFGLAVAVPDGNAEITAEHIHHLPVQRLSGRDGAS
ncbi:hypothetical protein D3C76_1115310 [compost metagenome]